jgi:site-specific DNA recombinase
MPNTNGHGAKRAILYARVSTDEQARSGYSLAQQIEALRAYAAREGYEILEEVVDPGQSGASLERPGMDRVRDMVAAGGVSVVLAQDRDRIAREPAYHYLLRKEFEEHGCKIRALNDRGDDSPRGSSRMAFSISLQSSSAPRRLREHGGAGSGKRERGRS